MQVAAFLLGILLGYRFCVMWVWATDKIKKRSIVRGYHFHHSLFFISPFLLAFFFSENVSLVLWGIGTGIVIEHTLKEGFKFITRE
jgi:hypothetical protein